MERADAARAAHVFILGPYASIIQFPFPSHFRVSRSSSSSPLASRFHFAPVCARHRLRPSTTLSRFASVLPRSRAQTIARAVVCAILVILGDTC